MGMVLVIGLFLCLILRIFRLARLAERSARIFEARLAQGVALLIAFQVLVHIGVNLGVLPTKGLTLPYMSYGGSSMVVSCLLMGLIFAIDRQIRQHPGGKR